MPVWVVTQRRDLGLPLLGVGRLPILLLWGLPDIKLGTTVLRDAELHAAVSITCSTIDVTMSAFASPASVVLGPLPIHLDTRLRAASLSHRQGISDKPLLVVLISSSRERLGKRGCVTMHAHRSRRSQRPTMPGLSRRTLVEKAQIISTPSGPTGGESHDGIGPASENTLVRTPCTCSLIPPSSSHCCAVCP